MSLIRIPRQSASQGRLIAAVENIAASRAVLLAETERILQLLKPDFSGAVEAAQYLGVSVETLTNQLLPRFQQMQQIELLALFADIVAE